MSAFIARISVSSWTGHKRHWNFKQTASMCFFSLDNLLTLNKIHFVKKWLSCLESNERVSLSWGRNSPRWRCVCGFGSVLKLSIYWHQILAKLFICFWLIVSCAYFASEWLYTPSLRPTPISVLCTKSSDQPRVGFITHHHFFWRMDLYSLVNSRKTQQS